MSSGVDYARGRPPLRGGAGRGAFGRYLGQRDASGKFVKAPAKDLQITLFCGGVRGTNRIISENLRVVRTAVERGIVNAAIEMLPSIAKKTGKMRRIFSTSIQQVARTETTKAGEKISFDLEQIKALMDTIEKYIKYHLIPGGDFPLGYKNPFTKNTRPLNLIELQSKIAINVDREVQAAQQLAGFKIR